MTLTAPRPIMLTPAADDFDINLVHDPDEMNIRIARAAALPDPTAISCAIAHAAVESFHGARPVAQLTRLVSPGVFEQLAFRARAQMQLGLINGSAQRNIRHQKPGSRAAAQRPTTRILRARVLRISPVAAEASVTIQDGSRVRAVALRVEEFRGRWRATVLQIG